MGVGYLNTENQYRFVPDGAEYGLSVQASPTKAEVVDPSGADVTGAWWALYVGTGGTIVLDMSGSGTLLSFVNIPNGTWLPVSCTKIYQTGTTASDILGMTG